MYHEISGLPLIPSLLFLPQQLHQYQQSFVQQQQQQYHPAQQPLPYMSSPLDFQIPLGPYNATTPTAGAAQMGGPSPLDPSYSTPR